MIIARSIDDVPHSVKEAEKRRPQLIEKAEELIKSKKGAIRVIKKEMTKKFNAINEEFVQNVKNKQKPVQFLNELFQSNHGLLSLEETITLDIQNISRVNYKKQDVDLPKTNITNHEISKSPI